MCYSLGFPRAFAITRVEYVAATRSGDVRIVMRAGRLEIELVMPHREARLLAAYLRRPLEIKQ